MYNFKTHQVLFIILIPVIILTLMSFKSTKDNDGAGIMKGIYELAPIHGDDGHNHIYELNTAFNLYNIIKNDIEGFHSKFSGRDYTYESLREDVNKPLIARASSGKMFFEILTNKVPINYKKNEVTFSFYSNIDLNNREPFDVFVNDKMALTFIANEDGSLKVVNNPDHSNARFVLVKRDGNNDGMGVFRLTFPINRIKKGEHTKIKVQGQQKGSGSWFMIFKTDDLIERLKISVENEISFSIKQKDGLLHIDAPAHIAGKSLIIECDALKSKRVFFKRQGDLAKATVKINAPKEKFKIIYGEHEISIAFDDGTGILKKTDIIGEYLYQYHTLNNNGWKATITKLYKPSFFESFNDFFDKRHQDGTISIINSSHQDIAWIDRPEVCIILRDTLLLTPILKDALIRGDYAFDIEDGLMLREYLERHPDAQEKITTLLKKNILSVGASYNCPYEDMYDAEDLVRQFYLGKKWVKKTFGGYNSKVYWNVDVPGKTMQFPQILKKAGVDYMVISRHAKGMFKWQSPDGSSVFTYSPGHYGDDFVQLSKEMSSKMKYGAEQVSYWSQYYANSKTMTPLLSSFDMIPAIDYTDFIETWNGFKSIKGEDGKENSVFLPNMDLMTSDEFLPLAEKNATSVETIFGERPNVWVYIHGPAHHKAITASREASKLIPAAEKFLSVANIIDPVRVPYPFDTFDKAWQSKIYPDHGWGGHDGDITDDLFKAKLVESRILGKQLLNKGTNFIASRIKTKENSGIPVVLFNSLSWKRTDPVTVSLNLQQGGAKSLNVITSKKQEVASQIKNIQYYNDGSIKSADVIFIAKDIPSIGYKTYYIEQSLKISSKTKKTTSHSKYENDAYLITFEKGGIAQIYDKQLKRNLLKTDKFKGGEVFTIYSYGNGAGEFGDIQQPFMQDFDKVSLHNPEWEILTSGDVYTTYRIKQQILYANVEQDVTIYHDLKRVLFETRILNWTGELYREFRTAFPIAIDNALITHEVPFGAVKVGQDEIKSAGNRYTALSKNVHPRAIMDWFSASDDEMTVTLSSSVAAIDWIDPTVDNNNSLLQHILLASRTSCHWEGNEYSQEGNHSFHNILTSNKTGDLAGSRIAEQQNDPIHVTVYPDKSVYASLPESASFFNIDKENVIVTTVKKAEDTEDLIIRMYDTNGENSQVKLSSYFTLDQFQKTNIIEEYPQPVSELKVPKYSIETFSFSAKNQY